MRRGDTGLVSWVPRKLIRAEIAMHTGNGFGGTNTAARRFAVLFTNTNTQGIMTHNTSAANGDSITINRPGLYAMSYSDRANTGNFSFGIGLNASGTTGIGSLTIFTNRIAQNSGSGGLNETTSIEFFLLAGDVITPHTDAFANPSVGDEVTFRIVKVLNDKITG